LVKITLARLNAAKVPVTEQDLGKDARDLTPPELAELVRWIDMLDRIQHWLGVCPALVLGIAKAQNREEDEPEKGQPNAEPLSLAKFRGDVKAHDNPEDERSVDLIGRACILI